MEIQRRVERIVGPVEGWSQDHEGASGTALRVVAGATAYYVKYGDSARDEEQRLRWLGKHLPVPEIIAAEDGLLVLADVGAPSVQALLDAGGDPVELAAILGRTLRAIHQLPAGDCPFDGGLQVVLDRAAANVAAGLVDPADFDDDHAGLDPEEILDRLKGSAPVVADAVVAHGDFTPSNVLVPVSDKPVLIDVPALGVADRYRDLAIARRDLTEDHGAPAWTAFLDEYGLLDSLDEDRLYYYRLLDELL
jgi:kanamycin kinase/aminoglycoside 3'-phosphotransferase-2